MEFKDYYKILGVEPSAEKADIKKAYRKLARKYHPDLNPGDDAEAKFKEVAEAWEVLGNDQRRAEFDELRRYGGRPGGGFEPPPNWRSHARAGSGAEAQFSGDFSDFFSSIFGDGFAPGAGQTGGGLRGQDVEIEMPIFLEETIEDTRKPLEYDLPVIENGRRTTRRKSLKVTIPAGVAEGERIRLKGQGGAGQGGAPDGDLYLHIRLVPHPQFDVEGSDLLLTVPLAPWEAALGAKVTVPTLEGKISLTVAPGSQSGTKLRVRGKGLRNKQGRGDLFAVLKVVMPTTNNDKTRDLWRQLSEEAAFEPRAAWEAKA
ncbi:DnaJ domain-containing protein [Parahaliea sp. F7430]|uniref:DnaJ domain-containing protein n=1 Tax=Sediminihaliea albiluteola TaxID=2758564 RepID=A0A7W2TU16_9GAMM|nr:DnaJ C-terminal domain-containing protein [Sediminihaliea albiluteola]MBA6411896.1 DnaJ domain-containing protein [Sediminihaliea albiluteola]